MDSILEPSCLTAYDYFNDSYSDKNIKKFIIHIEKFENKKEEKENYINNKNEEKENYIDDINKFEFHSNYGKIDKKKNEKEIKFPIDEKTPNSNNSTALTSQTKINNKNNEEINQINQINLITKSFNEEKIENKMLNKKRENKSKDKGSVKNIILNVYKSNAISAFQDICLELIKETKYYKENKIIFDRITNQEYKEQKAEKNLILIEKQLKDILSYQNEHNKKIIDEIFKNNDSNNIQDNNKDNNNDLTLKTFLNEKIKDLMFCFSCNKLNDTSPIYKSKLKNRYLAFIQKLKNKKKNNYINRFEKFTKDIKKTFEDMKIKGDKMAQKRFQKAGTIHII